MPSTRTKLARHPQRRQIERALVLQSPPLRDLAEQFGIAASNLCRYRQHMTPEEVAAAILDGAGGLSRAELSELCRREYAQVPVSIADRRRVLESALAEAYEHEAWALVATLDARLHALDEFTHRLYSPVLNSLDGADDAPPTTIIIQGVAPRPRPEDAPRVELASDVSPTVNQPEPIPEPESQPARNVVRLGAHPLRLWGRTTLV